MKISLPYHIDLEPNQKSLDYCTVCLKRFVIRNDDVSPSLKTLPIDSKFYGPLLHVPIVMSLNLLSSPRINHGIFPLSPITLLVLKAAIILIDTIAIPIQVLLYDRENHNLLV